MKTVGNQSITLRLHYIVESVDISPGKRNQVFKGGIESARAAWRKSTGKNNNLPLSTWERDFETQRIFFSLVSTIQHYVSFSPNTGPRGFSTQQATYADMSTFF